MTKMKASMFSRVIESGNSYIVYSIMGGIVVYPRSEGEPGELTPGSKPYENCVSAGVLVPAEEVEEGKMLQLFDAGRRDRENLRVTVLTTFQCNFACVYCVEEGVKGPVKMTEPLTTKVVEFIISQCQETEDLPETLHIQYYGGEPLMNSAAIESISRRLSDYTQEAGIKLILSMITNGSLIKPEFVRKLAPMGMQTLNITLDGPAETHDKKRPYKSGRPSFDDIILNIQEVIDLVGINIACNVDEGNKDAMPRLLDFLESIGLKDRIKSIKFNPIYQRTPQGSQPCTLFSIRKISGLTAQAFMRGFPAPVGLRYTICSMCRDRNPLVIDPQGVLYSCPAFVGHEEFSVGHIETGISRDDLILMDAPEECQSCPFLLVCSGGCRHINHSMHGDIASLYCAKDDLGEILDASIKMAVVQEKLRAKQE